MHEWKREHAWWGCPGESEDMHKFRLGSAWTGWDGPCGQYKKMQRLRWGNSTKLERGRQDVLTVRSGVKRGTSLCDDVGNLYHVLLLSKW